jgi:hypothetical protein
MQVWGAALHLFDVWIDVALGMLAWPLDPFAALVPEFLMPPAVAPSLLARLTRARRRGRRLPEPADMGTAFGMEQWLDERDHGRPPPATPTKAPGHPRRAWLPRWLQGPSAP